MSQAQNPQRAGWPALRSAWCRPERSSGRAGRGRTIRGSAQPRQDARPRLGALHLPMRCARPGFPDARWTLPEYADAAAPTAAHGRLRFGSQGLLIIGAIVDARADEHLAGQRLRFEFVILIVFGHICCFLGLSRFLLVAFHVLRYSTHAPARYERHIRKSPGRIASAHSGDSSTQLTIPTRAATAVRPTNGVRRTGCATARRNAIARPYVIARKYVIARNFPSGDDRRIGDQIIRTVVSRGILPFQHGDRRSVVHTETALRLERQRGLLVSPRQVKLMDVSSSVVYENVPSNASSSLRNFASAFSALTTGRLRFSSISAVE